MKRKRVPEAPPILSQSFLGVDGEIWKAISGSLPVRMFSRKGSTMVSQGKVGSQFRTVMCALLFFSQFFCQSGYAALAPDFFQSEQPAKDQSQSVRAQAIDKGFREILVKLAGSKQILLRPELRMALQNPASYLQTFTYFNKPDEVQSSWIRLAYNGDQIEALFYEQKLPLWSKDRPPLVFWFGVDAGQGRMILSESASAQQAQAMEPLTRVVRDAAHRRGMTVRFPTLDQQDALTVSLSDIWSLDMKSIANGSRRYNAQVVALGKITGTPSGSWYGQWGLEFDGRAYWFEGDAQSFEASVLKVMESFANQLGEAYAIEVGHDIQETVLLSIENINSLKDYAQASRLLEGLLPVKHFAVRGAEPGLLTVELVVQGGSAHLIPRLRVLRELRAIAPRSKALDPNAIDGSHELVASLDSEEDGGVSEQTLPETVLNYRWFGGL